MLSINKLPSACLCRLWSCSLQNGWSLRELQWIPTYTSSIWWAGIGIDLTWPLTSIVWACRLPPWLAQGKEDACPLSHTASPAFFLHQLQGASWQHPHGRCCIGQYWFLKLRGKDPSSAGPLNVGLSVLAWPPVAVLVLENLYWK